MSLCAPVPAEISFRLVYNNTFTFLYLVTFTSAVLFVSRTITNGICIEFLFTQIYFIRMPMLFLTASAFSNVDTRKEKTSVLLINNKQKKISFLIHINRYHKWWSCCEHLKNEEKKTNSKIKMCVGSVLNRCIEIRQVKKRNLTVHFFPSFIVVNQMIIRHKHVSLLISRLYLLREALFNHRTFFFQYWNKEMKQN